MKLMPSGLATALETIRNVLDENVKIYQLSVYWVFEFLVSSMSHAEGACEWLFPYYYANWPVLSLMEDD